MKYMNTEEILEDLGYTIGYANGGSFPNHWEGREMLAYKEGYDATAHYQGGLDVVTGNEIIGSYRVGPGPGDFSGGVQVSVCKVYKDWGSEKAWGAAALEYLSKRRERMAESPHLTGIITPISKYTE